MLGFFYNFWRKGFGGQVLEIHVAARSYRKTFPKLNMNSIIIFCIRPADSHNQRFCFCPGKHLYSIGYRVKESLGPRSYHISTRLTKKFRFARLSERGSTQCIPEDCSPSVIETLDFFLLLFFTSQVSSSFQVAILSSVLRTLRLHSPVDIVVCWKFFSFLYEYGLTAQTNNWPMSQRNGEDFVCTLSQPVIKKFAREKLRKIEFCSLESALIRKRMLRILPGNIAWLKRLEFVGNNE